jgi:hypothetical protein
VPLLSWKLRVRRCGAPIAAAAAALLVVATASAGARQSGTLVVRLATDPSPAGASWTYSGVGTAFQLGQAATEQTLSLPAGTYELKEAGASPGQPNTLTALVCSDPDGNSQPRVATSSATIGLEEGETVLCTFTHRALGRRSAAASLALARTYAPVLRLSSGEAYRPLRIEDYLTVSALDAGSPPRGHLLQSHPTLFSLPTTTEPTYLDVRGAAPPSNPGAYPLVERKLEATRPRPTVYWHIARQPAKGRVAIEYWLLYLYNDFYDRHESDWEGVTVILHGTTALGVSYSAHQGRRWSRWSAQSATGTHPIVYVARGSHANYARPGRYGIRVCWTRYGRHCAPTPRIDTATGTGTPLDPAGYDLQEFGGTPFSGNWGSGTYVLRVGLTRDAINDPRRRADYSNPFTVLGP